MCTVTLVPLATGSTGELSAWRMACSRDESHARPDALPPQQQAIDGIQTLMPIDPVSNGTWVGVNAAGLAITLLNYNLPSPPIDRDRSRGRVIPELLGAASVDQLVERVASEPDRIEAHRTMPFRLVACDGASVLLWRSTEPITQAERTAWPSKPMMFTSSGLGDHLVEPPRRELFEQWFDSTASTDAPADPAARQLAFHQHTWPGREHLSVSMHREDARTVSYTTVTVGPPSQLIEMTYHPDRPDREAAPTRVTLDRPLARL